MGFLPIIAILLVFWLLLIRPQQRRQREAMQLQRSIEVGDRVMLTSGFFGTVVAIHDDRTEIELAPGTIVEVVRQAIGSKVAEPDETTYAEDAADGDLEPEVERPNLDKTNDAGES